jgi:hypothetical protein
MEGGTRLWFNSLISQVRKLRHRALLIRVPNLLEQIA